MAPTPGSPSQNTGTARDCTQQREGARRRGLASPHHLQEDGAHNPQRSPSQPSRQEAQPGKAPISRKMAACSLVEREAGPGALREAALAPVGSGTG